MDTPTESQPAPADPADGAAATGEAKGSPFSNRSIIAGVVGAVVAGVLLVAVLFGGTEAQPAEVDEELAALIFQTSDGAEGTLADYRGEALVVNFFASWCGPCRAELPEFQQVHLANQADVTFVGVSHDLDEVSWRSLVEETGITFDTVFQPNSEIWRQLDAKGMPSTAFISPNGEVLQVWTGILSEEKLQELIDEHFLVEA
ncbi:MAG: TlpA disulfide reductase family protein [Actinomycetota bacterium]